MKPITENLLVLQKIARQGNPAAPEQQATIKQLRAEVPEPILAHFDRALARGKSGVAYVRNGICCECHMRVPTSTVASLAKPQDIYLCETCGCYLVLSPDELVKEPEVAPVAESVPVRKTRKKRAVATV